MNSFVTCIDIKHMSINIFGKYRKFNGEAMQLRNQLIEQISCHTFVKDIFDTSMDIFDTSLNIFGKCILIFNKSMYIFVTSINILENYWTITKNILFYVKIKPKIKKISTSRVLEFFPLSYSMFFSHFFSCNTVPLTLSALNALLGYAPQILKF